MEKTYSLTETILGKDDKYLDNRMLMTDNTFDEVHKAALMLQEEWEDNNDLTFDYPEDAVTLIHTIHKYDEDNGWFDIDREFKLTRLPDGTISEKTVYIYGQEG